MSVESVLRKQWQASYEMARDECARLRAERDVLRAENNLLQAAQGTLKAERDALNDALLHVSDMLRWDGDRGNWYLSPQFTVSMVEVALRSVRGE